MAASTDQINTVRHFNRFITRKMGILHEGLLHSPYSLTEARIIFELANQDNLTASHLTRELGLDAGYLSRLLARLEQQGLIEKVRSETDGRQRILRLTPDGKEAFQLLNKRSHEEVAGILSGLREEDQLRLLKAMQTIERVLDKGRSSEPYFLRSHLPGDMGWITHRHGVLYAEDYGWDESFEALVAQIVAEFINDYKPGKERCWIAEMDGEIVGSVMLVRVNDEVAKLRLLLVEPKARGLGLGTCLVEECIRFARQCGYKKTVLWTQSMLLPARHIYKKAGFRLVAEEKHHNFGHDLVGETWELSP